MAIHYNPSLSQEPRNHAIPVIARKTEESILGWLDRIGRLLPHEIDESQAQSISEDWDDISDAARYNSEVTEGSTDVEE